MTENETKAVKFIENIKSHATVTLDHIAKEEPNVSPLVYKGREEKANTILVMVEELKQYRAIGTPEECRAAVEKQTARRPDYEGDGYADGHLVYDTWICPCCGKHYEVDYDNYNYCPDCGQKLDWSDEMSDIFKDMQTKVGCDYISDLPSYKRKVWQEMKRLNPADYEERQLEDFSKYVFGMSYQTLQDVMKQQKGREEQCRKQGCWWKRKEQLAKKQHHTGLTCR